MKKSIYGMINSVNMFADELTNWLIDKAGLKHTQCQIYILKKHATYGSKLVVLYYVDDCLYWYISE